MVRSLPDLQAGRLLELGDEELPVVARDRRIVGVINLTDVLRAFRAGAL